MAIVDTAALDPSLKAPLAGVFKAIGTWLAVRRARQAQERTLQSLLFSPEHRLRDLGITREELIRATEIHRK